MTSANPPYPYFDGITYNSQFFNTSTIITSSSSTGGLTQAQANLLYLQKTTSDTATALETFSSGILTNTINPTGTTNMTIGSTIDNNRAITIGKNGSLPVSFPSGISTTNTTNGIITTKLNSQIGRVYLLVVIAQQVYLLETVETHWEE